MRNIFWILITLILSPILYLNIFYKKIFKSKDLKILVIDTGKIGDLVCATPVFREIKKMFYQYINREKYNLNLIWAFITFQIWHKQYL